MSTGSWASEGFASDGLGAEVMAVLWQMSFFSWCAVLLVIVSLTYAFVLLALSNTAPARTSTPVGFTSPTPSTRSGAEQPLVIFLVPCLNEGRVIGASLDRLLATTYTSFRVLVIDDASTDDSAQIVAERAALDPRVQLLRRQFPNAQQGKGAALNDAVARLAELGLWRGEDARNVIVVVVDADGRLEADALAQVLPFFDDPSVGGVQIGVRINNRHVNRLARMQDIEFVVYTEVFQRGRRRIGSVGLGGNGQFMRLAALHSLGDRPWSKSLTEDLDLGVRLLTHGWRNEYCPSVAVHQQGVVDVRRLVRQRTRWFQGGLQAWRLLPAVVRHVPGVTRLDLLWLLTAPFVLLLASLLSLGFVLGIAAYAVGGTVPSGIQLVTAYLLGFGPTLVLSRVYFHKERHEGVYGLEVIGLSHLYVFYGLLWYLCGWLAVVRTLRGQTGWAKTERSVETVDTTRSPDPVRAEQDRSPRSGDQSSPAAASTAG